MMHEQKWAMKHGRLFCGKKRPAAKAVRALRDKKKRDTVTNIIAELRVIVTIRQYYGDRIETAV
ncbi:hypothetical protein ACLB1Q_04675 [Escherichia coli]